MQKRTDIVALLSRFTFGRSIFGLFCFFLSEGAFAAPGITYHGRLLNPNGQPVISSNVQFRLQVRTPALTNCLLFEEIHTKDLSASSGVFSVTLNDGSATTLNPGPFTLDRIFQNRGTFNFDSGKCAGSTDEYSPGITDGRLLYVSFNDGSFSGWEPLPAQEINFVPMALEAVSVGGHKPSNFFRVLDGSTLHVMDPWTSVSYQKLLDLVTNVSISGGNASIGGNAAGFTGSLAGDVSGGQIATKVERIQNRAVLDVTPSNGQVLAWNHANSRWEPSTPSTSAAPSGGAGGDLTGSYPGPTIAANAVTTVKINDEAVTLAKLQKASADGQVHRFDGTDWQFAKLHYRDLINNTSGSPWPLSDCTAGQAIVWQSATDSFVCSSLTIGSANITDGSIATADLADGAVTSDKIAGLAVNKITSGAGLYLTYAPNGANCSDGQVLKKTANGWECGVDSGLTAEVDPTVRDYAKNDPSADFTTPSGVLTLVTVPVSKGGTGATTEQGAINNLLPAQSGQAGKILQTNGSNVSWVDTPATGITALTGDVTASGSGSVTATIANSAVTSAKILDGTISGLDLDFTGTNASTTGFVMKDSAGKFANFVCSTPGHIPTWSATGFVCQAPAAETDPQVGANTTNYLSKWDGSALVTSGVFESGGNVGIGTSTPLAKLDLAGALRIHEPAGDGGAIKITERGTGYGGKLVWLDETNAFSAVMTKTANDSLAFYTGGLHSAGNEKVVITSAGDVGVGKNNPSEKLDVDGNVKATQFCLGGSCISAWPSAGGIGTVTSVVAGTGLTGGNITSSGTIGLGTELAGLNSLNSTGFMKRTAAGTYSTATTLDLATETTGTLALARGGTGATTRNVAINNLLPAQSGQTGKILQTDGTDVSWVVKPADGITALTGDVTASGSGSVAATIANNAVTSAKILNGTINGVDLDFTGVQGATTNFVMKDSTGKFANFGCSTSGHVPTWSATGFVCQAPAITETDPQVGANTTNYLSKWDGSALVTSGVFESGGNVGIGTMSPNFSLEVQKADSNTTAMVTNSSSTASRYPGFVAVNYSGGLGGSPSFQGLGYRGTVAAPAAVQSGDLLAAFTGIGGTGVSWNTSQWASGMQSQATETFSATSNGARLIFFTTPNTTTGWIERMRIEQNGNVGIGTMAPADKLDVIGKIRATHICAPNGGNCKDLTTSWTGNVGTVTEVTSANTDISVSASTSAPVLTLNSGVGANQILKLNASSQIPAVSGQLLTNLNATNLASGTVNVLRLPAMTGGDVTSAAGSGSLSLTTTGVTAGTYKSVTVDAKGRVTGGTNPTTIAGYGITDAVLNGGNTGAVTVGTNNATALTLETNNAAAVTILSGGNVGIGTAAPAAKLQVVGNTLIEGDVRLYRAASAADDRLWIITHAGGDDLNFAPRKDDGSSDGNYAMTMTRGGNIGVGTTAPTAKVHIAGTAGVDGMRFPDGTLQTTAFTGGTGANIQVFTSSGTWTKPSGGSLVKVECWGGGGGGGKMHAANYAGGGGGGGSYAVRQLPISSLASTEVVTIGAGGVGRSASTGNGTNGGSTTFGAWVLAGGGAGGTSQNGGGGGGPLGAASGDVPGSPSLGTPSQGAGGATVTPGNSGAYHGGGGGGGVMLGAGCGGSGGASLHGGGGGGGGAASGAALCPGGISMSGGAGGAGARLDAEHGQAPGGGGGGTATGTAGNGAPGQCIVTVL